MTATRRLSALLIGDEPLLIECGQVWLGRGHEIVGVVTDDAGIRAWAEEFAPVTSGDLTSQSSLLRAAKYDYLFSIANLRMLPSDILERPRKAAINFHDGPLPEVAGMYATTWGIYCGNPSHGVTWHLMDRRADSGAILERRSFPIEPGETAYSLNTRCFDVGAALFRDLVVDLETGHDRATPQDLTKRRAFGRFERLPGFGVVGGPMSAEQIDRTIRSVDFGRRANPLTVPKLHSACSWIAVSSAHISQQDSDAEPGTIIEVDGDALLLSTTSTNVRLSGLRMMDGSSCDGGEALEALSLSIGDGVESPGEYGDVQTDCARVETRLAERLQQATPATFPDIATTLLTDSAPLPHDMPTIAVPAGVTAGRDWMAAAWIAFVARITGHLEFTLGCCTEVLRAKAASAPGLARGTVPLNVELAADEAFESIAHRVASILDDVESLGPGALDLGVRRPDWPIERRRLCSNPFPIGIELAESLEKRPDHPGEITLQVSNDGSARLHCGPEDQYPTAVHLAGLFSNMLAELDGRADVPVSELLLAPTSRHMDSDRLASPSEAELDARAGVTGLIDWSAPGKAVAFGGEAWSYAELDARSDHFAGRLQAAGAGRGSLVAIYLDRSADMLAVMLGVWKAGAAYLPLDPAFPSDRLEFMLEDSGADYLVSSAVLLPNLDSGECGTLLIDEEVDGFTADLPALGDVSDDLAYVLYTSGSSGKPKGVLVPHRALVNFLHSMQVTPGLTSSDTLVAVTTTSFDISVLELYLPLTVGAEVVIASRDQASEGRALIALMRSHDATVMQATPATWRMLLESGWSGTEEFKALCGGEPFPADLVRSLLSMCGEVWNMYGPTETTIWSTCARLKDPDAPITIGKPIANTKIHIVNASDTPQPVGVPGELLIGGAGVTDGYLNRPELTAERFVDDWMAGDCARVYRTGDLAVWCSDGSLIHLGRMDDQVKVRGFRIELGEIEAVLMDFPGVSHAAVSVWEHNEIDHRLVAYVVPSQGQRLAAAGLRKFSRQFLPDYMIPQLFIEVGVIPLTPNGKIDRKALPPPSGDSRKREVASLQTETERTIARVWARELGQETIGRHDNFFDIGGHSLLAARVAAELESAVGIRIELRQIVMEELMQIAAYVDERAEARAAPKDRPGLLKRLFARR